MVGGGSVGGGETGSSCCCKDADAAGSSSAPGPSPTTLLDSSSSSSSSRILARATLALERLVTSKRDAVLQASVLDAVDVVRQFNARVGHALWRQSLANGGANGSSSSGATGALLDAELSSLVKDFVAWLGAVARYKPGLLRLVCGRDVETSQPLAPGPADPEALQREDAELLAAVRLAHFSPVQLELLSDFYRTYLASVRRADAALRDAARDLSAALEGEVDGGKSTASGSWHVPAAAAVPLAPPAADAGRASPLAAPLLSDIERALVESQAAVNVATVSLLQVVSPRQYATLFAARHPRVATSAAMLRSAWLLLQQQKRQQQQTQMQTPSICPRRP